MLCFGIFVIWQDNVFKYPLMQKLNVLNLKLSLSKLKTLSQRMAVGTNHKIICDLPRENKH